MKLSEMHEWLSARGIQLTKSLGQNFLHDGNQLRRIVEAAELTRTDRVLEIGPGLGPLTELLLAKAGEVLAIEKDARLVEILQERFSLALASQLPGDKDQSAVASGAPALRLIHDDALEFVRRGPQDWSRWKLVANLPYSVASPILIELAQMRGRPECMVVTLQSEVAQRLMAEPSDKDYGVLTLLIQLDYEPRRWFKIPASCFFPAPNVDSACVVLKRRTKAPLADELRDVFMKIVKRAFSQRRKMMAKLLKADWPEERLLTAFKAIGLQTRTRAEAVGLEPFVRLTQILSAPSNRS